MLLFSRSAMKNPRLYSPGECTICILQRRTNFLCWIFFPRAPYLSCFAPANRQFLAARFQFKNLHSNIEALVKCSWLNGNIAQEALLTSINKLTRFFIFNQKLIGHCEESRVLTCTVFVFHWMMHLWLPVNGCIVMETVQMESCLLDLDDFCHAKEQTAFWQWRFFLQTLIPVKKWMPYTNAQ